MTHLAFFATFRSGCTRRFGQATRINRWLSSLPSSHICPPVCTCEQKARVASCYFTTKVARPERHEAR